MFVGDDIKQTRYYLDDLENIHILQFREVFQP